MAGEDADGKLYTAASVISSDLDLSARFSSAIGSLSESAQTSIEIIGNVMVVKVARRTLDACHIFSRR